MNLKIKKLKEHFEKQDAFSEQDVLQFYQTIYPKVEKGVLFWNIFDLKERGVIEKVGKDRYQLVRAKNQFTPNLKTLLGIIRG